MHIAEKHKRAKVHQHWRMSWLKQSCSLCNLGRGEWILKRTGPKWAAELLFILALQGTGANSTFIADKTRSLCSCFEVTLLFSDNEIKNIWAERKYLIDCAIRDISWQNLLFPDGSLFYWKSPKMSRGTLKWRVTWKDDQHIAAGPKYHGFFSVVLHQQNNEY